MGGLFGGGSAKTDRGQNLGATQGSWNLFGQGLGVGTSQEGAGINTLNQAQSTLQPASDYWKSLLTAGRTQTAQNSAPAINAALAGKDAQTKQAAEFGTGRSGATVAQNAGASTATNANIDNIINQNLIGGREAGAKGLESTAGLQASIGGQELTNAMANLGLSQRSIEDILSNSQSNYQFDTQKQEELGSSLFSALMGLPTALAKL